MIQKKFNGYHLKLIALVTMFVDHVAAVVVWRLLSASYIVRPGMAYSEQLGDKIVYWVSQNQEMVFSVYEWMRLVGRMAFPIYCFLIVEGFLHTRSVGKYALRLLAFAFISEIPFDLALFEKWNSSFGSNVYFTLFLGLLLIWGISYVEKFLEFWEEKKWDSFMGRFLCMLASLVLAITLGAFGEMVLEVDYGMAGVFSILVIYLFRYFKTFGYAIAVLLLTVLSSDTEIVALLMLIPLLMYDGTRGKQVKYLFYGFYPIHLLALALLCMAWGI